MPDGFTATLDGASAVAAAFGQFADEGVLFTKAASKISADNMQAEMRSRVARASGKTAEGVTVSDVGDGYVVHTADVNPFTGLYYQGLHIGLWLEKGTRLGRKGSHASAARPWFFVSAELEVPAHERRIAEALEQARDAVGLGD